MNSSVALILAKLSACFFYPTSQVNPKTELTLLYEQGSAPGLLLKFLDRIFHSLMIFSVRPLLVLELFRPGFLLVLDLAR